MIQPGTRITVARLLPTTGYIVHPAHLAARCLAPGVVAGIVPGHGGDVWFVRHDSGAVAAYSLDEMEEAATDLAGPAAAR